VSWAVGLLHLAIGLMAIVLASLALVESIRSSRLTAHRHFGLALSALVTTAAAHYIVIGLDRSGPGQGAIGAQLTAAGLALLPVAVFLWLRVEAYLDGPGDRFLDGKPIWIPVLPSGVAGVTGAVLAIAWMHPPAVAGSWSNAVALRWLAVLPSILLVATSIAIGWSFLRGQQTRHAVLGGWSLSGLAVTLIFPTSAVSYATQALTVRPTLARSVVDWLGVPAALWFWYECRRLTGTVERSARRRTVTVPAQHARRPAPWAATDSG